MGSDSLPLLVASASDAEEAPVASLEGSKLSVGFLEIASHLSRCLFLGDI